MKSFVLNNQKNTQEASAASARRQQLPNNELRGSLFEDVLISDSVAKPYLSMRDSSPLFINGHINEKKFREIIIPFLLHFRRTSQFSNAECVFLKQLFINTKYKNFSYSHNGLR